MFLWDGKVGKRAKMDSRTKEEVLTVKTYFNQKLLEENLKT